MAENPGLLAVLVGASGSGKSTLAREVFGPANVVSSDALRELISGDAGDQEATKDAFTLLRWITDRRCSRRLVTAVDSVALRPEHRLVLQNIAMDYGVPCVAVAVSLPLKACIARQAGRERQVPEHIIKAQHKAFQVSLSQLPYEGFAAVYVAEGLLSTEHQAAGLAEFLARHGEATHVVQPD